MGSMDVGTVEQGEASAKMPSPVSPVRRFTAASVRRFADVNRELWLLLSLFLLAALLNSMLDSHRMLLGLYTLPTLFSAYVYGRRHATLTALQRSRRCADHVLQSSALRPACERS